jgi:hypothetical protein
MRPCRGEDQSVSTVEYTPEVHVCQGTFVYPGEPSNRREVALCGALRSGKIGAEENGPCQGSDPSHSIIGYLFGESRGRGNAINRYSMCPHLAAQNFGRALGISLDLTPAAARRNLMQPAAGANCGRCPSSVFLPPPHQGGRAARRSAVHDARRRVITLPPVCDVSSARPAHDLQGEV